MKFTNLKAFEKHVKEASPSHFASLYLILAKDAFARKSATDILVQTLLKSQNNTDLALKVFSGDEHPIEKIVQELNTYGLFATQKLILIHNFDKLPSNAQDTLRPYFAKPIPTTTLVLNSTALNANTQLFKQIEKAGIILDIPEEKPWEKEKSMQAWAIAYGAEHKKRLDEATSQFLIKQLGTDQAAIQQELDKLCCYVDHRPEITTKDILAICISNNTETIWQLGDAIFKCDPAAALRISKGMLSDGVAFIALLRQIRSQFQTDFQICSILSRGGNGSDVAQQFPNLKGTILERRMQSARTYGMKRFRTGLLNIDNAELKAKNSADAELLNDLLMIQLTT